MKYLIYPATIAIILLQIACATPTNKGFTTESTKTINKMDTPPIKKSQYFSKEDSNQVQISDEILKKQVDKEIFEVSRLKGTEYAFSGKYWNKYDTGTYYCTVCGNELFKSEGKFESSCGWPSFFEPSKKDAIVYTEDKSHGMKRVEVKCGRCDGHLGHVFEDGPPPTGLRYCINSVILDFEKAKKAENNFKDSIKSKLKD